MLGLVLRLVSEGQGAEPAESLTHPASHQVRLAAGVTPWLADQVRAMLQVERVTKIDNSLITRIFDLNKSILVFTLLMYPKALSLDFVLI